MPMDKKYKKANLGKVDQPMTKKKKLKQNKKSKKKKYQKNKGGVYRKGGY